MLLRGVPGWPGTEEGTVVRPTPYPPAPPRRGGHLVALLNGPGAPPHWRRYFAWILSSPMLPGGPGELSGVPGVAEVDGELLEDGDRVRLDGEAGVLELPEVVEVPVVTVFLQRRDGRVLLLRRSDRVGSFRGRWAAVSGHIEGAIPRAQALQEVVEETGLRSSEVQLLSEGPMVYARDGGRIYAVHPFRFHAVRSEVTLDWEHTEAEWVDPTEILRREVVPRLYRAWSAVRPTGH